MERPEFRKISDFEWEIPADFKDGMRVPARIIASKELLHDMESTVFDQITNVAHLPGIQEAAYCMPDGHQGYGFPIGGVAATDPSEGGIISPGGIGYDINCGMRLVTTNLTYDEVKPKLNALVNQLFAKIPAGVGKAGLLNLDPGTFREVAEKGAEWCVEHGYGWKNDLSVTEEQGRMHGADANFISDRAVQRGKEQVGTLGSGNHYLEIQRVLPKFIHDEEAAERLGLFPGQVVIMFHCGSRGFGHQIGTDYLNKFQKVMAPKYGIDIPDRELMCAPFQSEEGQEYYKAMQCGINFSFANRQVILHRIREVFSDTFGKSAEDLEINQVYDVAHNTAKLEEYKVGSKRKELLVHRKGATRALGPGNSKVPKRYRDLGQPVILGGSMETGSWVLLGTEDAEEKTFGSTAHGAGRRMSRTQAKKQFHGGKLQRSMQDRGIVVKSVSQPTLAEEAGGAYKDVNQVIDATVGAGISKKVVELKPIGNIKG